MLTQRIAIGVVTLALGAALGPRVLADAASAGAQGTALSMIQAEYAPRELIVRFAPRDDGRETSIRDRNGVLTAIDCGAVSHAYRLVPGLTLVRLPSTVSVEDAVARCKVADDIAYAHPNYIVTGGAVPNDPRWNDLWGLKNTGQAGGTVGADIDAPGGWDIATDASRIIVAVIDSGADYTHPDLAANMWINDAELNGTPRFDDDGNGWVDDIYGYDFCTLGQVEHSDPMDELWHGTHVAGTVGAVGDNGEGVCGVSWSARVMALRFLNANNTGSVGDAIRCVEYAMVMGAKVLNNSWGSTLPLQHADIQGLLDMRGQAEAAGCVVVACAHNFSWNIDAQPVYPASFNLDNIISVLATDRDDVRSEWPWWNPPGSSNWGPISVDLAAPGTDILSSIPPALFGGNRYGWRDGTSMATPHVSGACALVWAANPALSHYEVKQIILSSVDVLPQLENDPVLGRLCATGGRLNLHKVLLAATEEPAHRWPFDEGSGAIAYDSVGGNYGALGMGGSSPSWDNDADRGWCLSFDGDDYVCPFPIAELTTGQVQISAWIRPNGSTLQRGYLPIVSQYYYSDPDFHGYDLCLSMHQGVQGLRPTFYVDNACAYSGTSVAADQWYHVVGTYDGSHINIYVNGQGTVPVPLADATGVTTLAYIGRAFSTQEHYFIGKIDDVRVYGNIDDCFPSCHDDHTEWAGVGKPDCWCFERQCHGDADGMMEGAEKTGLYYVHFRDLNTLLAGWNVKEPPLGPGIASVEYSDDLGTVAGICADFAHDVEGTEKAGLFRVHFTDLNILMASWNIKEEPLGPGIATDCLDCGGGDSMTMGGSGSEQVDFERMMAFLEGLWLDEEALKGLDQDALLRVMESLAEVVGRF